MDEMRSGRSGREDEARVRTLFDATAERPSAAQLARLEARATELGEQRRRWSWVWLAAPALAAAGIAAVVLATRRGEDVGGRSGVPAAPLAMAGGAEARAETVLEALVALVDDEDLMGLDTLEPSLDGVDAALWSLVLDDVLQQMDDSWQGWPHDGQEEEL